MLELLELLGAVRPLSERHDVGVSDDPRQREHVVEAVPGLYRRERDGFALEPLSDLVRRALSRGRGRIPEKAEDYEEADRRQSGAPVASDHVPLHEPAPH